MGMKFIEMHDARSKLSQALFVAQDDEVDKLIHSIDVFFPTFKVSFTRRPVRAKTWVVMPSAPLNRGFSELICNAHLSGVRIVDYDAFMLHAAGRVPAEPGVLTRFVARSGVLQGASLRGYFALKTALEPVLAFILLVSLFPLLACIAVAIKMTSEGSIIYSQGRVGFRGRRFIIHKFRTMRTDAERDGVAWSSASRSDSRLTPIGGFLRSTHLDELPQLWNIVRGELGFIGPRPERPEFVHWLEKAIPLFGLRHQIRPGVTGWAQVNQGYANSTEDSLRKLEFDLYYLARRSPGLDFRIVLATFKVLAAGGTERIRRERSETDFPALESVLEIIPVARPRKNFEAEAS